MDRMGGLEAEPPELLDVMSCRAVRCARLERSVTYLRCAALGCSRLLYGGLYRYCRER